MRARIAAAALIAVLGAAAPAWAGDPIMPLSQVRAGMHCTALSVIQGTEISSFNADVVAVSSSPPGILVRVSGPAVDATGAGQGFSGSPIYCPDGQGTPRNIGAIAGGLSDYGNKTVLAQPIEQILAESASGRAARGRAAPRLAWGARPLAEPLSVTGLSPALARAFTNAGRRAGRAVIAVQGQPYVPFPPQVMRPGAAVAADVATGDLSMAGIGTVAYTDGDAVWAFGHSLDQAGRRSLLLEDAYVYTVINNPIGSDASGLVTYKLATPGNVLGTFTNDGLSAVVGRVGALPPLVPVNISATDGDTGRTAGLSSQVVDETDVDQPTGQSALALVGALGVDQAALDALRSAPARLSQTMCAVIHLRERKRGLKFCNRYILGGSDAAASSGLVKGKKAQVVVDQSGSAGPSADVAGALSMIDTATFRRLHVTSVYVSTRLHRGLRQAFIQGASARTRVRPGQRVVVTLTTRIVRGAVRKFRFRLRIPRSLPPGPAVVSLVGTPSDSAGGATGASLTTLLSNLLGDSGGDAQAGGDPGPQSVDELADAVASIERFDGVLATYFADEHPGRHKTLADVPVFRSGAYRISGNGLLLFDVLRARR
jgi:hypothetical protein